MFNKLRTLFVVLIIIICGAAYAEYEGMVNGIEQQHAMQAMDMTLNGNVYEIQPQTLKWSSESIAR